MTEPTLQSRIRTVGLEEHAWIPSLRDRLMAEPAGVIDDSLAAFNQHERGPRLIDLGEERLRLIDDAGIDMQVLSTTTPGTQSLPAGEAPAFAREANDALSHAVAEHPDRFAAFATLPTPDPDAAAAELERAITQLGFVGVMLFPRTGERYVDADEFRPIFEVAAELRVPLYLHPEIAPHSVRAAYYSGFSPDIDLLLATGGWGWHSDTGVSALRLILAGTFDRHPELQLILGHWGEMLVFFMERVDIISRATPQLQRRVADYITHNLYVTPSGIYSHRMLAHAIAALGADRVMFSSDFPFQYAPNGGARNFLESAPISPEDKAKIGSGNAERLLRLGTSLTATA